jgi:hypothetical protein
VGLSLRGSAAAMLVLLSLATSSVIVAKPVFSLANETDGTWVTKAAMHQARSFLNLAAVNGKIYAIGGSTRSGDQWSAVCTNEEYDPATDTWTFKASMPTPRTGFATAVYQNKIYCIGGKTGSGYTGVNEVYDPATNTWETKTSMPTARTGLRANVASGKVYLIGGYVPDKNLDLGFSVSDINEVYDPETDSWTTKASMPTAAGIYASAVVNDEVYVIGGDGAGELNQVYDPQTDTWSQRTPLKSSTATAVAGATTGVNAPKRIYVLGQFFHLPQQPYFNLVYDPETDSWIDGVAVPTARRGLGVAILNDTLYAIGGHTETYSILPWENPTVKLYATNEQYTPLGYGTPDPSYDGTAPEIVVVLPRNETYFTADVGLNFTDVALNFTVDEPVFSVHYVLDGGVPVEISGNTTIAGLAVGAHNVSIFGFDASGNMGTSETVCFAVAELEPFPVVPVAAASAASVAVAVAGLVVYLRRRNHRAERLSRNLD